MIIHKIEDDGKPLFLIRPECTELIIAAKDIFQTGAAADHPYICNNNSFLSLIFEKCGTTAISLNLQLSHYSDNTKGVKNACIDPPNPLLNHTRGKNFCQCSINQILLPVFNAFKSFWLYAVYFSIKFSMISLILSSVMNGRKSLQGFHHDSWIQKYPQYQINAIRQQLPLPIDSALSGWS